MAEHDVVVIGAGQGGIASALALKDRGVAALVVDKADQVASGWRARYDRLRLNSSRPTSHLPGRPYPKGTPMFPTRDQVVEHIDGHARNARVELLLETPVKRLSTGNGSWTVETGSGEIDARQVVVATGYENEPFVPDWDGRESFAGELIHSAEYRNADRFRSRRVLVVGPGCSGMEIAYDVATGGAAKVWLAVRTPPTIISRAGPGGLPGEWIGTALLYFPTRFGNALARFGSRQDFGDLSEYGLPVPREGLMTRFRRDGTVPSIVDKEIIDAVKQGKVEVVGAVKSLNSAEVILAGGSHVEPDAIICATGYRRALEPLVGHLGVLDDRGLPAVAAPKPAAPGLRFVGYTSRPGALGFISRQSKQSAKAIAREVKSRR
ncbi:MAG: flavin-containing monooxygenase [Solirubrobacteraceae bacterium]